MLIQTVRDLRHNTFTLATLSIDGHPFCFVCEDVDRGLNQTDSLQHIASIKVHGRTAIPAGTYRVGLRNSPKHGDDTLYLMNVPGFDFIDVHAGNTAEDTEGCQLVGLSRDEAKGEVFQSRDALKALRAKVVPVVQSGALVQWSISRG